MCCAELDDQEAARQFFERAETLKDHHRAEMSFDLQAELLKFHREAETVVAAHLTKTE